MPVSESKRLATKSRRKRVAQARIKNTPVEVIAASEGVSPKTIRRDLHSPQTRTLLAKLCVRHEDDLNAFFGRALGVVREGMEATRLIFDEDGDAVSLEPDHQIRLAAVREGDRLLRTATQLEIKQADNQPQNDQGFGELLWDDFLVMRARRMARPPGTS